jgi:hypothetical protein
MLSKLSIIVAIVTAIVVQAAPAATVASPAPVPVVTDPSIAAGLLSEPSNVDRLKKLLWDSSGKLLTGEDLRAKVVFDFNQQKAASGAKGGSILLATIGEFSCCTSISASADRRPSFR